jgi:aminoglycoside phosphotransferase
MDTVLTFLNENRQRLELARYGANGRLSSLVLTPRFRASSHVVFLVLTGSKPAPVLVAKAPRLVDATASLEREVANLRLVQSLRPDGFASIPEVVAFEAYHNYLILVETALVGQPMDPPFVRQQRDRCCGAITDWLLALQQPAEDADEDGIEWFQRLVEQPLHYFGQRFPLSDKEAWLLRRTRELIAPLRGQRLPLVFEHGDLSYPNLMLLKNGEPGVVDWELAEPYGLPVCDLFFFLTYAAFATHKARENGQHLAAFQAAFFEDDAWTKRYIRTYAEQLHLPADVLTPLFVLTWLRYIVGLLLRLEHAHSTSDKIDDETAHWLRRNRYYTLWDYAVSHANELTWST